MNNWVKVTSEEIKKDFEISKLKKGELQIQLAKALVKLDKINEYITNFSVDKNFSFPLMKRWEENQVKSSIDYQFN